MAWVKFATGLRRIIHFFKNSQTWISTGLNYNMSWDPHDADTLLTESTMN